MKNKLSPANCKDFEDVKKLECSGIGFNDQSIVVQPNHVVLTMGHTTIIIGMKRFRQFAEWYLEDQEIKQS